MIPGFRDPAKRFQSYEPPSQLIHDKKNTPINAPMQVKNENHINVRLPEGIVVQLRKCREYINALEAENKRKDEEISLLRKSFEELCRKTRQQNCENARKLFDAKSHIWCTECLNQIDKSQLLCSKCEAHKQHSS